MNERNKENKEATRTGSMTKAERINQGSWETADKNWIPSEGKLSVRQLAHVDRRGVKKVKGAEPTRASTDIVRGSRMNLAERVLSELSKETLQSYKNKITPDVARMRGDKGLNRANTKLTKIAQGKNTPRSVSGGKSNQTATTAYGGTAGSEENKVNRATPDQINRSRSDNPGEVFKKGKNQPSKKPSAVGTSKRAVKRANQRSATKGKRYADSEWDPSMGQDTTRNDDDD